MKRKKVNKYRAAKSFNARTSMTKAINHRLMPVRGGYRL